MKVLPALAAAMILTLTACSDGYDFDFPDPQRIDVDTPRLRTLKAEAGVEGCRPGERSGASDLPEVTLPCFGGGPEVDLSSLEGPLVINFWAGWCEPCRKEMPALQAFHEKHPEVPLIGINRLDPQVEKAMQLVVDTGVTYPLLADSVDELSGEEPLGTLPRMPMFAFVDVDGSVEVAAPAGIDTLAEVESLVAEHLEVGL